MCALGLNVLHDLGIVIDIHTSTCGDKLTDDNVLLESHELIGLTADSRICKSLCSLLEGRCGEEGIGVA